MRRRIKPKPDDNATLVRQFIATVCISFKPVPERKKISTNKTEELKKYIFTVTISPREILIMCMLRTVVRRIVVARN